MTHRSTVVFITIAAFILAGCQIDNRPQDVAHFSTNRAATKDTAETTGTFILYRDDSDNSVGPMLATTHLMKGEIYGFEVDEQQIPFAIAGKQRTQLTAGRYRWEMTPDAGQTDWEKTGVIVLEAIVITGLVAVTVVVSIVLAKKVS